jgi:hypothetical protein
LPEGQTVTKDKARKKAVRARMADRGEPYSVAARGLAAAGPADDATALGEVTERTAATLAVPSARIEFRSDIEVVPVQPRERRRPGFAGRLARRAARAAWERVAPGWDAGRVRDAFEHQLGEGVLEPAAGRYLVDYGGYAQLLADGKRFGGLSGQPLQLRHQERHPPEQPNDPLTFLTMLRQVSAARYAGGDPVRGTMCRKVNVQAGSAELTVWIDENHVRRIQSVIRTSTAYSTAARTQTLELWDFGAADGSLDWSRLPSFRTPG